MAIEKASWGSVDGSPVDLYTLSSSKSLRVSITTYGARIVSLYAPDRRGQLADVMLGFDDLAGYTRLPQKMGAPIGRVANRIAGARFVLNGATYHLAANQEPNHIHGGLRGFDVVIWKAVTAEELAGYPHLRLAYRSADGEEGYPGNLDATITYSLTPENDLRIDYEAVSDKDTVINLTNHAFFNLAGAGAGDILSHELAIDADAFTVADAAHIPTGEIRPVAGTPLDFRQPTALGARIHSDYDQVRVSSGYDQNFVLNHAPGALTRIAELYEPQSGRVMETYTTEPGVQLFTSNNLNGSLIGKGGVPYQQYAGVCLETQHFPDAPNHPNFPSIVLHAGERYSQTTCYRFMVR